MWSLQQLTEKLELCIGLNPGTVSRIISEYGPFLESLE